MQGQAKALIKDGWDVAAMNHRGCSGEENRLYLSYNSGRTQDLSELIDHILTQEQYSKVALIGFSLGGNLLLKYLGEPREISHKIVAGIAISAPIDLQSSLDFLMKKRNRPYTLVFLKDLRNKYKRKMKLFPRSEEHTSELQSLTNLVCRLLLEKKKQ